MLLPLQGVIPPSNFPKAMPWAMCSLPLRGAVGQMRILKFLPYGQWVCDKSRAFRVQIILCDSASLRFINKEEDEKEGLEGKEMLFAIFTGF
jgi:hypothetical protein